jgi:uncharacterized protein (UPF0332 family)
MRAKEFAVVASRLSQIPAAGPADFRTSISRAYYAAFHVAVEALTQIGAVLHAGPGGHSEVANCLIASGDDAVRDAGRAMSDLHTRRIHADYRMARTDVETRTSAQSACEIAHDIIRELEAFCADQARCKAAKANIDAHLGMGAGGN